MVRTRRTRVILGSRTNARSVPNACFLLGGLSGYGEPRAPLMALCLPFVTNGHGGVRLGELLQPYFLVTSVTLVVAPSSVQADTRG